MKKSVEFVALILMTLLAAMPAFAATAICVPQQSQKLMHCVPGCRMMKMAEQSESSQLSAASPIHPCCAFSPVQRESSSEEQAAPQTRSAMTSQPILKVAGIAVPPQAVVREVLQVVLPPGPSPQATLCTFLI